MNYSLPTSVVFAKAIIKRKFLASNAYINEDENKWILKKVEKQQNKLKECRRKDLIIKVMSFR